MFYPQERFAITHLYSEKIKFFKQKIMFFLDKKLMFYKEMNVFNPFLPNSELWPTRVGATCIPGAIWHWGVGKYHLKSSQLKRFGHRTITRFGVEKTIFPLQRVDGITTFWLSFWFLKFSFWHFSLYWTFFVRNAILYWHSKKHTDNKLYQFLKNTKSVCPWWRITTLLKLWCFEKIFKIPKPCPIG